MRGHTATLVRAGTSAGVAIVAFQLVALALGARDLVLTMSANADLASPLVMAQAAPDLPGSQLVTGHYAWFNGLWPAQVLRHLPAYSSTSNYLPLLLTVLASLTVAIVASRLWGALPGVVAAIVLLAIGSDALSSAAAWSSRAPTWWGMVALAAIAVWAVGAPRGRARVVWALAALLAVLWAATSAAHDQLAWIVTAAPLAAAALAAAVSLAWRPAAVLAGLAGAIVLVRFAVNAVAGDHYAYVPEVVPDPIRSFDELGGAAANLLLGVESVWRSFGTGTGVTAAAYLGTLVALVALVAGFATLTRLGVGRPSRDAGDAEPATDRTVARRVWVAYWLTVFVLAIGAFVAGRVSGTLGAPVPRYLYMLPFAVAALLAAGVGTRMLHPAPVLVAVAALGLLNGLAVLRTGPVESPSLHRASISRVVGAAGRYDLDRGFASYWTAAPMVHATDYAIDITPAGGCPDNGSGRYRVCRAELHHIDGAYRPRRGIRSFLLVDSSPTATGGYGPAYVTLPPAAAKPERVVDVGDGLQMYVYAFDIATVIEARS